jgi:hypothetical protein
MVQAVRRYSLYRTTRIHWSLYSQSPSETNLMPSNIDIRDGSISLGEGLAFVHNMSLHQVLTMGLVVRYNTDMKTGWHIVSIWNISMLGRPANTSLYFFREELKQLQFLLLDQELTDSQAVRKHHDDVLTAAFGSPHARDVHGMVKFIFPWGNIESSYDPRSDQSHIVLTWK